MTLPELSSAHPGQERRRAPGGRADLRSRLLRGSALCGMAAAAIAGPAAAANILPTMGGTNLAAAGAGQLNVRVLGANNTGVAGQVAYTSTGASADLNLTAPRTVMNWTTYEVGAGNTLNYNFSAANDIVINKVASGAITVDAGGVVHGLFNGATGGNIWFLAANGVFIHGTVTAGGVLASNNIGLTNLQLLSDNVAVLKTELATAASLIDLSGTVTATDASIDGAGNIVLNGDIDAGATGQVTLKSTGTVTQTGGAITTATLSGSSVGGATLNGANVFDTLAGFTNTGAGGLLLIDAQTTTLTVTGAVDAGVDNTLTLATNGPLTLQAGLTAANGPLATGGVILQAGGAMQQTGGVITTGQLNVSTSVGDVTLTRANVFDTLVSAIAPGNVSVTDASAGGLTISGEGATGADVTLTTTNGGALVLSGGVLAVGPSGNGVGGTVTLDASGPISQPGGFIGATSLTGASVGGADLSALNDVDNLAGFTNTGGGDVTVTSSPSDGTGLAVTGLVDAGAGGNVNLSSFQNPMASGPQGPLTVAADIRAPGGSVNLLSSTAISQTGGVITTGTLTLGANSGDAVADGANVFDVLGGSFATGALKVTDASAGGMTVNGGGGLDVTGDITLTTTNGGKLAIDDQVFATGTVGLFAAGAISESAPGSVFSTTLTGASVGGTHLDRAGANFVSVLGAFANTGPGGFSLANVSNLTVSGVVRAGGGGTLTLDTAGSLTLAADLHGNTVDLISAFGITQTAGAIIGATLTGASAGAVSLTGQNQFDRLGAFSQSLVGPGNDVSITDAKASGMTVVGAVDAGADNTLTLTTAGPLTLSADLTAGFSALGGAIDLVSGGAISQTAGVITAQTLFLQSAVGASLPGANQVADLYSLSNTAAGDVSFSDAQDLIVDTVSNPGGSVHISTTGALLLGAPIGAGLDLVLAAGTTLTLSSSPTVGRDYAITAQTFAGQALFPTFVAGTGRDFTINSLGSLTLDSPLTAPRNLSVSAIGGALDTSAVSVTATGGALTLSGDTGLTVGATSAVAGPTLLASSGGGVLLIGAVDASGQSVTIAAAGAVTESGGAITAASLQGTSAGGASLDGANVFDTLGGFTDTAGGAIAITDTGVNGMTVTGLVDPPGPVTLTTTAGPLVLAANIAAPGATVTLNSAGAISQTAGAVTAGTLLLASVGDATLTGPNRVAILGGFNNGGGGTLTFTDARATGLTIQGILSAVNGDIAIRSTAAGAPLTIAGDISVDFTHQISLISAGAIDETTGQISGGTLTGSSVGGASIDSANAFANLGAFTNAGVGPVSFTDTYGGLTVVGAVRAGAGNSLTIDNAQIDAVGDLVLSADLSAPGGTVALISAAAITQTAGVINAGTLTLSSVGAADLNDANQLTVLGASTIGAGLSLTDARPGGLIVNGGGAGVTAAGDVTLTTAGPLAVNDLISAGGTIGLFAGGAIREGVAGGLSAVTLTGSSVGGASLGGPNTFADLGAFANTGAGDVTLADTFGALTVTGPVDAGAGNVLTLINGPSGVAGPGPLTLAGDLTAAGGTIDLISAGAIIQTGGVIITGTLTGSSVGGAGLTDANLFDSLGPFVNSGVGAVSIADAQAGGLTVAGAVDSGAGNDLSLTAGLGPLTLAADVTAAGATVNLSAGGAISQTGGIITTAALTGAAGAAASLTGANQVGALGAFTVDGVGALAFTDAVAGGLTVNGPLSTMVGDIDLVSSAPGAALTLAASLNTDGAHQVSLISAGQINQVGGIITTGTLTGSSVGGANLGQANAFAALGPFTNTGAALVTIADANGSLTVAGPVRAGAGSTLTLVDGPSALGAAGDLVLAAALNAPGGQIDLISAAGITQTAGAITTGALGLNAAADASLGGPNSVAVLGPSSVGGALTFNDARAAGLTVDGGGAGVTAATDITLTTAGPLAVNDIVSAGGTIGLFAGGAISEGAAGALSATTLAGSSVGGAQLDVAGANVFANLGPFINTGAGAVAIADASGAMTVTGAVDAGAGNTLTLTNAANVLGGAGALTLAANVKAAAGTVDLISAGTIGETSGAVATGTLTGSSVGGTSLTGANQIARLGPFANTGAGGIALTDARAAGLTVTGDVDAGAGDTLTLAETGGPLVLAANLTAAGGVVNLGSASTIGQTAGIITAATLNSASNGAATLTGTNQVNTLAGITNGGAGDISFTDAIAAGFNLGSDIVAGAGNITLTSANPGTTLTLSVNLTTDAARTVSLNSAGALVQKGGIITTGSLTGSSSGGASLTDANQFGALAGFNESGGGAVSITDASAGGMIVTATVDPVGPITLTTTSGPLTLLADVAAPGQVVTFNSAGSIDQLFGVITAATLNATANGAATLTGLNQVGALGTFTNGGSGRLAFTDAIATGLTIDGALSNASGDIDLASAAPGAALTVAANLTTDTAHQVNLSSQGPILQTAGVITTGALNGSSVGGASLTQPNAINGLGPFTNSGVGAVSIANFQSLNVTGDVDAGAGNTLTLTALPPLICSALCVVGDLILGANVTAAGGVVNLVSDGAIVQTAGIVTTGTLTLAAGLGATLNDANLFDVLGASSVGVSPTLGGSLSVTDAKASGLTVDGGVAGVLAGSDITLTTLNGGALAINSGLYAGNVTATSTLTLNSAGAISEGAAGGLGATTLTGSSAGGAQLDVAGANGFANLGPFTNTGVGDVSLYGSAIPGFTVIGTIDAGAGNTLTLTNIGIDGSGPLVLNADLTAAGGTINLISADRIIQTGGVIATGTLTGSSYGGASLTGANLFDTLGGFTNTSSVSTIDTVAITDAKASGLTVSGPVDAGGDGALTLTTTGGPMVLAGNLTAPTVSLGGSVALSSASTITQTAGVITTPILSVASNGAALLTGANQVIALAGITNGGAGNISFTDAIPSGLTVVSDIVAGAGDITLTSTNPGTALTVTVNLTTDSAHQVSLNSAGALIEKGGIITTGALTGASVGGAILTGANLFDTLAGFNESGGGSVSITDAKASGMTVTGTVDPVGDITLNSAGALTLAADVSTPTGTVNLNAGGTISETTGIITAATLNSSTTAGDTLLTGLNQVAALGILTNGGTGTLAFTDANATGLTISGGLATSAGDIDLRSAAAGATLTVAANLTTDGAHKVSLISAGQINQTAGIITTGTLTGSSVGGASLAQANGFAGLGPFANTGGGLVSIANLQSLNVTGAVNAGPGATLTLTALPPLLCSFICVPGDITLAANVAAAGGVVNLISDGSIIQTAGNITTATLTAAGANITLDGANRFDTLGHSVAAGSLSITDAKAAGLTVDGGGAGVTAATDITLTTAGPLAVNDIVSAGGTIGLFAGGAISEGAAGALSATTLAGSSVGGAQLAVAGANVFANLGPFINTGAGAVAIADASGAMTVTGAVDAGAGNTLTLTNAANVLGGAGALTLAANVKAAAGTVDLISAGTIGETSGAVATGTLTGSSVGGTSLTGANQIARLGPFANTGAGGIALTDARAAGLTVTGDVDAGAGDTLTLAETGGPLVLAANLTAAGGVVNLGSASTIGQTAGIITAATLNSASNGSATLTGANQVGALGSFTNGGAGTLAFTDAIAGGLTISGDLTAGAGDIDLAATAGPLTLAANLTTDAAHQVSLVSAGPLAQTAGIITTGALTGSSVGGASLDRANVFDTLAGFTNAGTGPVLIVDTAAGGLTVSGAVNAGAGNNLGLVAGGPLTLQADLRAAGAQINLTAAGAIDQTGGVLVAAGLRGTSNGGASLTQANLFTNLLSFTETGAGAVTINDARAAGLTVAGALNAPGSVVTLTSAGPTTQGAGSVITADTLNSTSAGAATLTGQNQVINLGTFANGGAGTLAFTDAYSSQTTPLAYGLTVTKNIDAGAGDIILTSTAPDALVIIQANLTTGAAHQVDFVSAGPIGDVNGIITTGTLTGSARGVAVFLGDNNFANLAGFTVSGVVPGLVNSTVLNINDTSPAGLRVTGPISTVVLKLNANGGPLTLAADVSAPAGGVVLASTVGVSQTAGIITTGALSVSGAGPVSLNGANQFDTLGLGGTPGLAHTGTGDVSITDAKASGLTVAGDVDAGAGNTLTLVTTNGGSLTLAANVSAAGGTVDLVSSGAISQTGGVVTAATLQGSSVGGASLTGANLFDALGPFANTGAGAVSITDAQASGLSVTGDVDAGAGNTLTLTESAGALTLAANLTAAGGSVDLVAAGAIDQTGGVITTAALSGSSVGGANLALANAFDSLAGFTNTGAGQVIIADAQASGLTVTQAVDAGAGNSLLLLSTGGALTLAANVTAAGGQVGLTGLAITQTGGVIDTGELQLVSLGDVALNQANQFDVLGGVVQVAGNLSLTDARASGLTVDAGGAGVSAAGAISLTTTNGGSLTLNDSLSAGGVVRLNSAAAIDQTAGVITATGLRGSSVGGASLTGANLFDTLGPFTNTGTGAVSITDAQTSGLTVSGAVNAGAGNALTLTATAGGLTLASNLTAAGGAVDLVAAGAIDQTAGIISTASLAGSSVGGASLTGANQVAALGPFANTGGGGVSITDARALAVTGDVVDAGAGNTLTLTTTNGGPLTLSANLTAAGGTIDLVSAGAISQTAGVLTANTLTGSSVGGASLTGANLIANLGAFANTASGNVSITDAAAGGLTVTQALSVETGGALTLTTTNGGALTLAASLTAAAGTVDLVASGAIRQTGGQIFTRTLTGSSVGGASLTGANQLVRLGPFVNAGAGAVSITDARALGLTVGGAVDAGAGNRLTLTTTNGGPLTLAANVSAAGGTIDLISSGSIQQTGGIITAATLTGSSVGGASLTRANLFDTLAGFDETGGGAVSITDAGANGMTVSGTVDPVGDITLATTAGPLVLGANVTAPGSTVNLISAGAISQTGGIITAGTITANSAGDTSLGRANLFDVLAASDAAGALSVTDAKASGLTLNGAGTTVQAAGGLTLTTTNGGSITLNDGVASGGVLTLNSAGAISEAKTTHLQAAMLTGRSVGGTALNVQNANSFDTLAGFANTGAGGVAIADSNADGKGLTVTGPVNAGAGDTLVLANYNSNTGGLPPGPLTLRGNLTAANGAVTLISDGAIVQAAGVITTASLSANAAAGDIRLNDRNQVDSLADVSANGSVAITDARAGGLTVGPAGSGVAASGDVTLTTVGGGPITLSNSLLVGGALTLASSGQIIETATGRITAGSLGGSSVGGAQLDQAANNSFDALAGFTNTGAGAVSIADFNTDGKGLTVTGAVDAGAGNALTLDNVTTLGGGGPSFTAPLTLAADVSAAGGSVTLISGARIVETGGAIITTGTLSGSSKGGTALTDANLFDTLSGFTNGQLVTAAGGASYGNVSIADAKAGGLTVSGAVTSGVDNTLTLTTTAGPLTLAANLTVSTGVTGGAIDLTSAGAITQSGGVLSAATLNSASHGAASLTGANQVGTLASFANGGAGDLSFTDDIAGGFAIGSAIDAQAGNLTLTSGAAGAALVLPVTLATDAAHGITLVSGGAITQQAGAILRAGSLSLTSVGGVSLGQANLFDTLGAVANTGASTVNILDAQATGLTVTGPVDAGAGSTLNLTTTAGPLGLAGLITAANGTVNLVSAGVITQTGGFITATNLSSASHGAALLSQPNLVQTLVSFTNGGSGDLSFNDAFAFGLTAGLTVGADLNAGNGNLTLTSSHPGTPLTLTVNLSTDAAHTVNLVSAGAITQVSGVITTGTLTGSSVGAVSLTKANLFDTLGAFANSGAGPTHIVDVKATGLTVAGPIDAGAGHTLILTATQGPMTLTGDITAAGGVVDLAAGGAIDQTGGVITAATLNSAANGANLLTGQNQVATLASFTNGGAGDMAFTDAIASGFAIGSNLNAAAGNLTLTSSNPGTTLGLAVNLTTDGAHAVRLVSAGAIDQTAGVIRTGALSGQSTGGAALTDANAFAGLTGFTNLDAGALSIVDTRSLNVSGVVDNTAGAAGGAGRDIALTLTSGSLSGAGVYQAARDVAIDVRAGSLGANQITAGAAIVLRAQAGGVNVSGSLTSGQGAAGSGAGAVLAAASPIALFGQAEPALSAGSIDIGAHSVNIVGPITAAGATSDVRILASGPDTATSPALRLGGAATAGRDIALDATGGSIQAAGALTAGRDVAARSLTGNLSLASATAGDDIVLASPAGAVTVAGSLTAVGAAGPGLGQTLFATLSAPLDGLFALGPQSVFVSGRTFSDPGFGQGATLSAGGAIGLALSDPAGLSLADADPGSGSWVRAASLLAPTVALFESGGDVNVGAASVEAAVSTLELFTGGRVHVTGRFVPVLDNTVSLAIGSPTIAAWTPSAIEVINDPGSTTNQGSIGFTSVDAAGAYAANPQTFFAAALFANSDILLGSSAFIAANASITDPSLLKQIDPNRPVPATAANTSRAVTLAAGDVSLAAGRLIVQQDTAGLQTSDGVGSFVARTLTLAAYGPASPPAIDLFGVFRGTSGLITGPAAALTSQIRLAANLQASPFRALYRFNSCEIGNPANCSNVVFQQIGVQGDPINQNDPAFGSYPSGDGGPLDTFDPRGLDNPPGTRGHYGALFTTPLLAMWQDGMLSQEDQDIEDPTITGAPNEEIWRRAEDRP